MSEKILVPVLGESITEATVAKWLKNKGDDIKIDDWINKYLILDYYKGIFKDYFGIKVLKVNSLRQTGKSKRFRGIAGKRNDYKKFYVSIPEDAKIESLSV